MHTCQEQIPNPWRSRQAHWFWVLGHGRGKFEHGWHMSSRQSLMEEAAKEQSPGGRSHLITGLGGDSGLWLLTDRWSEAPSP